MSTIAKHWIDGEWIGSVQIAESTNPATGEGLGRVTAMFASDENVAVFGDFRYKSLSLGRTVTSPFAILVKVVDGQVTYLQFLEDTYATAASFRKDGTWTVQTEPDIAPFQV